MCYIISKEKTSMIKFNILRLMYNYAPMNFYNIGEGETIIKALNNTSLGYKFPMVFTSEELHLIWRQIKLHKRISSIFICLLFIYLLYEMIFPQFAILVNNNWYINALIIIFIMIAVSQIITFISTKIFEKRIKKRFGEYERKKFVPSGKIDKKYYNLYKMELVKVLILAIILMLGFAFISPFNIAKKLLNDKRYNDVVRYTTVWAKLFPIAQEWYSMRGYANYKLGNMQDAINDFEQAYTFGADGFNMTNFDNKIFIKYEIKDYDGAIKDFNKEIKKAKNRDEKDKFLWDKAQFLYNIGRYNDALKIYTKLIARAENDREYLLKDRLYFERAQTYKQLGMDKQADEDMINSGIEPEEIMDYIIPEPMLIIENLDEADFTE